MVDAADAKVSMRAGKPRTAGGAAAAGGIALRLAAQMPSKHTRRRGWLFIGYRQMQNIHVSRSREGMHTQGDVFDQGGKVRPHQSLGWAMRDG